VTAPSLKGLSFRFSTGAPAGFTFTVVLLGVSSSLLTSAFAFFVIFTVKGAFAEALACGGVGKNGYQVIKKETLALLCTEQFKGLSLNNGYTCIQGDDYNYGLGVRVRSRDTEWGLEKGEFGWDGAAGSYLMVDPKQEISVFIGMNVLNWPAVFIGKHLQIVEHLYKEFFY
jgi:CubicO group peptidase (beta-lactamase class C family)